MMDATVQGVLGLGFALLAWLWAQAERRSHLRELDKLREGYQMQIALMKRIADDAVDHARQAMGDALLLGRRMAHEGEIEKTPSNGRYERVPLHHTEPPPDNVEGDV